MKKYNVKGVCLNETGTYDLFIFAPNIEKRSYYFIKACTNYSYKSIIAFDFENTHQSKYVQYEKEKDLELRKYKIKYESISDKEFLGRISDLAKTRKKRIAVDITGFSIPQIYQILRFFYNKKYDTFDVFYTEPKHYKYAGGLYNEYRPEILERICRPIRGFYRSGKDENEILIILLGFENGLSYKVFNNIAEDPSFDTFVINGLPAYSIKLKDVSLLNNASLINHIGKNKVLSASAVNPFSVYNTLLSIRDNHPDVLIDLCAIGPRPMALGACLFNLDFGDSVKSIYPHYVKTVFEPKEEPGKIWKYEL